MIYTKKSRFIIFLLIIILSLPILKFGRLTFLAKCNDFLNDEYFHYSNDFIAGGQNNLESDAKSKNSKLSSRTFDIVGKGKTAEQTKELQAKLFCRWPYFPTGIWCKANESITVNVTGGNLTATIGTRYMPMQFVDMMVSDLKPGTNTFSSSKSGLLYFSNSHSGTIKAEVTSGGVSSP
ncbi:MAG: hypothetical protein LBU60_03125, partial [Clostridiales bacterium]|nr:hypothetical protein [Clostridiales bacterium]